MTGTTAAVFAQDAGPSFTDSEVLDEFRVPFGDWLDQAVNWATVNLNEVFDWIKWPFVALFNLMLESKFSGFPWEGRERLVDPYFDFNIGLMELPWWIIVLAITILAFVMRNARVAAFCAVALTVCGLLGPEFWAETVKTIGMVLVAVVLCAVIGIPLGVLCGRVDAVWSVVRPTLDAMQVVHSFVYMLPFIFFFGIGEVSATMVSMVFALPPLVRLTNLGIRQVPEDVVEASRAFGAPERRVLFDVQLPLARTAIMTGLNQTLLLAFSMLGIAAIMGAGGLGRQMFRAINNQNTALAASAGLAFFLVAVVMDRISQREGDERGFMARLGDAWSNLRTPENLLPEADAAPSQIARPAEPAVADLTGRERTGLTVVLGAAVLGIISVFLNWSSGSFITSHSRAGDLGLTADASGLDATGGSWFGIVVLLGAFLAVVPALGTLLRPGAGGRLQSPESSLLGAGLMLGASLGFIALQAADGAPASKGIGVWLALIAAVAAFAGGVFATIGAPYGPDRPLPVKVQASRVFGGVFVLGLLLLATFSFWTVDERGGSVYPEQFEAQILDLEAELREDPTDAGALAELAEKRALLSNGEFRIDHNAWQSEGPGLGWLVLALGIIATLLTLPAAGMFGVTGEPERRLLSAALAGVGFALMGLAVGWIGSLTRATDPGLVSGVGSFMTLCAGFIAYALALPVLKLFFRTKVYDDAPMVIAEDGISIDLSEGELATV